MLLILPETILKPHENISFLKNYMEVERYYDLHVEGFVCSYVYEQYWILLINKQCPIGCMWMCMWVKCNWVKCNW